jgi:prephenate dehydrogenase
VRDARIVILALPFAGMRETLQVIAHSVQEGTLVLDTAPSKATIAAWAKEFLPPGRFYIGLTPAINPEYLHGIDFGVKSARADLFDKGLMVVNAPNGTPENVFNLTMELVALFGAVPLLMDTTEADGIFAAIHMLPQLASAALLDTTVDKPGWLEARKLAGRPYASVTSGTAFHDDAVSLRDAALENRENVVRLLNAYITSLINLRDEIEENDRDALSKRLESAWGGRMRWFDERLVADWLRHEAQEVDIPSFSERVNQMLFGSVIAERGKPRK